MTNIPSKFTPGQLWQNRADPFSFKLIVQHSGVHGPLAFVWIDRDSFHMKISRSDTLDGTTPKQFSNDYEYLCTIDRGFSASLMKKMRCIP